MRKIDYGSKIGIHCTQGIGSGVNRLREMVSRNIVCPVFKVVDNLGAVLEAKKISPNTIFIYRFVNPDDSAQNIEQGNYDYIEAVNRTFAMLHDRVRSPEEKALLSDPNFYIEILNEADPPGVTGWKNFGNLCRMMVERANTEGIKIVLPAFNSGTPEWDEFIAFADTGVFVDMVRGGHLWSIHEGPFGITEPIITYGPIPGASNVLGAGIMTLRYRYWINYLKSKNIPVPNIVISEFYAGGGHNWETGAETAGQIAGRLEQADNQWRLDDEVLGVLPFTLGGDEWKQSNYDFAYDEIINYMDRIKGNTNGSVPPKPPSDLYKTVTALNVRAYAWTDTFRTPPVIRVLGANEQVTVYWILKNTNPTKTDWACISPNRNEWVSMAYLSKV